MLLHKVHYTLLCQLSSLNIFNIMWENHKSQPSIYKSTANFTKSTSRFDVLSHTCLCRCMRAHMLYLSYVYTCEHHVRADVYEQVRLKYISPRTSWTGGKWRTKCELATDAWSECCGENEQNEAIIVMSGAFLLMTCAPRKNKNNAAGIPNSITNVQVQNFFSTLNPKNWVHNIKISSGCHLLNLRSCCRGLDLIHYIIIQHENIVFIIAVEIRIHKKNQTNNFARNNAGSIKTLWSVFEL